MIATGQWDSSQSMGRLWPVGCVALEITQRCNLDCAACYLSPNSEAVQDLPLGEVFRRIGRIRETYGPCTAVQVTGGDPTLRKREDLIVIVRRIRDAGMLPTLFTNGIKVTRALLAHLKNAGLAGIAFHVDMTQGRSGYRDERELNGLRRAYIERARDLGLEVFFNTTVFDGNFDDIPCVVAFFVQHSDVVSLASFQPAADVGRSRAGLRSMSIDTRAVIRQIERGSNATLSFDTAHIGHSDCNRYGLALVANGRVYDVLDNRTLYDLFLTCTTDAHFHGQGRRRVIAAILKCLVKNPALLVHASGWAARKVWDMRLDLMRARGRVNKLSFFIHNFMDACHLDSERLAACVFMAATEDEPVPMCLHNAHRDEFMLGAHELDRMAHEFPIRTKRTSR